MQMGSPGLSVVAIRQSSGGILRNRDSVSGNDGYFYIWGSTGPVVGEYGHMQLLNPGGSGITALIDDFQFISPDIGGYKVSTYDTALAIDQGFWRSNNAAAVNGVCKMYMGTNGTPLGAPIYAIFNRVDSIIFQPLKFPLVLEQGKGIVITHPVVNVTAQGYFAGREI